MFRPKCGTQLPDGASTCEACGWNEETISSNPAPAKKAPSKKVIISIIAVAVVVILLAAIGAFALKSTSSTEDDPSTQICGVWKSESAGVDVDSANDLLDYDRATAIFNEDGTGSIDPTGNNTKLPWTWRYCEDETKRLGGESLVYEITFKGIEDHSVYVLYKDDGFLLSLPETNSGELTLYFVRSDSNQS